MKTAALLLCAALLGGCAMQERVPAAAPAHLFADARFGAPTEAIDTSQLFTLSPAMRAYLDSKRFRELVRSKGEQRGLIEALYSEGDLKLDYDATVTRPAAYTFNARSGNCLSLVIMTAAFARELGQKVTFQEVRADETWSRQGSLYVANTHVNILLGRPPAAWEVSELYVVDFLPQEDAARHKAVPLEDAAVVAMYANNRGAEALADGRLTDAYWWVRKAMEVYPSSTMAYNTLGVVYQRYGAFEMAESVFREVLAREPYSRIAMHNLAPVLESLGKQEEARSLRERVARLDPEPPFHFFRLGQAAMDRKDYRKARELFAREVARAPYYHEFHFWYALASLQLGETSAARDEIELAQRTSTTAGQRARYAAKLEHLRAMVPAPRRR